MSDTFHLGINFAGNFIQVVELESQENKLYISCLDEIETNFNFNNPELDINITNPDAVFDLVKSLSKLFKRDRLNSKRVSISLNASSLFITQIPVDIDLDDHELQEHLEWEVNNFFPGEPSSVFNTGSCILESVDGVKKILLVVVKKEIISFFKNLFRRFNLDVAVFDVDHFAAIKSLIHNYPECINNQTILVGLRLGFLDFSVLEKGRLIEYKIKKMPEEKISQKGISSLINSFVDNVGDARLYLYGKDAKMNLLQSLRVQEPERKIELLDPFKGMDISSSLPRRQELMMDRLYFAPAVGLALRNR